MKMKIFGVIALVIIGFGCHSNENKNEDVIYQSERDTAASVTPEDSSFTIINRPSLWTVEMETHPESEKLKKPSNEEIHSFSPSQLIDTLNNAFTDIQLHLIKQSHDTLYVSIPQSKKLTQELGNTGAENYMASIVYNLTELKNVKFVNFQFTAGDHAEPGVYSREDFKRLR